MMNELLYSVMHLKDRHVNLDEELIRLSGQGGYYNIIKYYGNTIDKLSDEINLLPTGYRYSGIFYIKKAYIYPVEFEKITGTIFMREDLVSWRLEDGGTIHSQVYFRAVFREPSFDSEIKKEDTSPVYDVVVVGNS